MEIKRANTVKRMKGFGMNNKYIIMDINFKKFLFKNSIKLNHMCEQRNKGLATYFWVYIDETFISWYILAKAVLYKAYTKTEVVIILNDMWKRDTNHSCYASIIKLLESNIFLVRQICNIDIIKLSSVNERELSVDENDILMRMAEQNAVFELKSSEWCKEYFDMRVFYYHILRPMVKRIKTLLKQNNIYQIIAASGIFGETGFLVQMCLREKVDIATWDSDLSAVIMGKNCIAAQNGDFTRVQELKNIQMKREMLIEEGFKIFKHRSNAESDIGTFYQGGVVVQPCERNLLLRDGEGAVVIFPNLEFDAAAMGMHSFFQDDFDWMTDTIDFILDNTSVSVVVREHPMQSIFKKHYLSDCLKRRYRANLRFQFIPYNKKINSYDLIKNARAVIAHTSTIGLEAAMMGKRVITESNAYYADAGFMKKCEDVNTYHSAITEAITNGYTLSQDEINEAAVYYAITQGHCVANTIFTPYNGDCAKWLKMNVSDILKSGDTKLIMKAIASKKPLMELLCEQI